MKQQQKQALAVQVEQMDISIIEPNEGQIPDVPVNPRTISEAQFKRLCKSLQETPEMLSHRQLIVYPLDNGHYVTIGGNQRLRALQSLGYKEVPVSILPKETPAEHLRAIIIKDNASFGDWDMDLLANEWDSDPLEDWGLSNLPMPGEEVVIPTAEEVNEDGYDESEHEIETIAHKGSLFIMGEHRLLCGDSTDMGDMALLMEGRQADLWITDPPYNVDYAEKEAYKKELGYGSTVHEVAIANDKMNNNEFLEFLTKAYSAAKENLRPGAAFYIWHADTEGLNFRQALVDVKDMKLSENLIWVKDQMVFGRQDYHWKHEPCLYGWKEGAGHSWYSDRSQTTILEFPRPKVSDLHPTMKPIKLFAYHMECSSKPGDIVLDSFGGSGTTLIAAENMGRIAYLMEYEPHYCDVIVNRWETLTGKKAVHIDLNTAP